MGYLFLCIVVVAITATSLLSKLALLRKIGTVDLATSLFGISTIIGAVMLWGQPPAKLASNALIFSAVGGIGGSLAVLAFNQAIRSGHFGLSNAIYRSSFLVPVVFSVLFLDAPIKITTACGTVSVLAGIFFMSCPTETESSKRISELRWLVLILLAFLFSGAPRIGQTLTSACHENYFLYLFLSYAIGAAILLVVTLFNGRFAMASLTWGTATAVTSYIGVLCTLKALEYLKPQVVFPITLTGPIILGIVISLLVFREKIHAKGWTGVLLGITGITILAIWK